MDYPVKSLVIPSLVEASYKPITTYPLEVLPSCEPMTAKLSLLDLYAGCGGMSMGLCLGAKLSGLKLVTVINRILSHILYLLSYASKISLFYSRNGQLILIGLPVIA